MVTDLIPVYNAAVYLQEAIESILSRSFRDFEFLIINDGSTEYIASMGADDLAFPDRLERQVKFMDNTWRSISAEVGLITLEEERV